MTDTQLENTASEEQSAVLTTQLETQIMTVADGLMWIDGNALVIDQRRAANKELNIHHIDALYKAFNRAERLSPMMIGDLLRYGEHYIGVDEVAAIVEPYQAGTVKKYVSVMSRVPPNVRNAPEIKETREIGYSHFEAVSSLEPNRQLKVLKEAAKGEDGQPWTAAQTYSRAREIKEQLKAGDKEETAPKEAPRKPFRLAYAAKLSAQTWKEWEAGCDATYEEAKKQYKDPAYAAKVKSAADEVKRKKKEEEKKQKAEARKLKADERKKAIAEKKKAAKDKRDAATATRIAKQKEAERQRKEKKKARLAARQATKPKKQAKTAKPKAKPKTGKKSSASPMFPKPKDRKKE